MKKILVVDDEASVREVLSRLLKAANFDVVLAEDGLDGLEKAGVHRPDLVISDVIMPRMNGLALCAALKSNPATSASRFLFVTTQTRLAEVEEAMKHAPDGYITKPFDLGRVLQKIESILGPR